MSSNASLASSRRRAGGEERAPIGGESDRRDDLSFGEFTGGPPSRMLPCMGAEIVAARRRDLLPAAVLRRASDQRLVEQALAGSERAFEVLFDRHHRPVLAFCKQILGSREEAEDAVQQTFLAANIASSGEPSSRPSCVRGSTPSLATAACRRCERVVRALFERCPSEARTA